MRSFILIILMVLLFALAGCQVLENASSGAKSSKMMTKEEEKLNKPVLPDGLFLSEDEKALVFREVEDSSQLSSSDYHDMCEYLSGLDDEALDLINQEDAILIDQGVLISDLDPLDDLLMKVRQNQRNSLSVVNLTIQGHPVIDLLLFDGIRFYGIHDTTRDPYVIGKRFEYEFLFLKKIKTGDEIIYLLINSEDYSDQEIVDALDSVETSEKVFNGHVLLRYQR